MAYTKKEWKNKGENGANESNSKLDKNAMNDLENRIQSGLNEKVSKNGDTINGFLYFNSDSSDTITKDRPIGGNTFRIKLGLEDNGSLSLQLINQTSKKFLSHLSLLPDGTIKNGITNQILIEGDSGWKDLTLKDGISVGSVLRKAQYRKVGKVVYIRGDVSGVTKAGTMLASLPVGYRPSQQAYSINSCAGTRNCRVYCNTDGTLALEWVNDGSYNLTWYCINMVFMVD